MILALSLSPTGDWTEAAAIMTFAIPVGLFVVVSTWLYFLYTRPHAVPGHRDLVLAGAGGHAAGAVRPATAQAPPAAQPPSVPQQPPAPPQQGGGTPGGGGQ